MNEVGVNFHQLKTTKFKVLSFILKLRSSNTFSVRIVFLARNISKSRFRVFFLN